MLVIQLCVTCFAKIVGFHLWYRESVPCLRLSCIVWLRWWSFFGFKTWEKSGWMQSAFSKKYKLKIIKMLDHCNITLHHSKIICNITLHFLTKSQTSKVLPSNETQISLESIFSRKSGENLAKGSSLLLWSVCYTMKIDFKHHTPIPKSSTQTGRFTQI